MSEASPFRTLLGIDVDALDPGVASPSRWPGQSLLGKALAATRMLLRVRPVGPDEPVRPEHSGIPDHVYPSIHEIAPPADGSSADGPYRSSSDARGALEAPADTPVDHSTRVLHIASVAFPAFIASRRRCRGNMARNLWVVMSWWIAIPLHGACVGTGTQCVPRLVWPFWTRVHRRPPLTMLSLKPWRHQELRLVHSVVRYPLGCGVVSARALPLRPSPLRDYRSIFGTVIAPPLPLRCGRRGPHRCHGS